MAVLDSKRVMSRALVICLGLILNQSVAGLALAKEYLLTAAKPDRLFMIDMGARKIVREYKIPGPMVAPMTFVPSPDGKVVYVVTNHEKSITGIDMDSGREVFRADTAPAFDIRTKNFGLEISPDGKELYSYDVLTQLHADHYEVLDPRISVFASDGGVQAKAVRSFAAPRRIHLLMMSTDGKSLYALGKDFYTFDPQTGALLDTYPFLHWKRPNLSPPDLLNFWPLWDQTMIFRSLYTVARTNLPPTDPNAFAIGILSLDLKSGKMGVEELKIPPEVLFTIVTSPNRRDAFAVFNDLVKIDLKTGKAVKRVDVDHSYYIAQISGDGREVYLGGTMCDIPIYAADTLEKLDQIDLPGCPDMGGSPLKIIRRE